MKKINTPNSHTVLFLSHGGGPLPLLDDSGHNELVENLKTISGLIEKPAAIIVISAHWEAKIPTITHAKRPPIIYDYSGFPEESYEIKYPVKGNPELARSVFSALSKKGFDADLDEQRGFDHGLFVPLKIMYPKADIHCIQVSLLKSLDPAEHIKMGEALAEVEHDNLLIIGSGFSFHNMHAFFTPPTPESRHMNESFDAWLTRTCSNVDIDEKKRKDELINWEQVPFARYCHPREEHLLPLHVCYGAAGRAATKTFEFKVLDIKASAYLW